MGKKFIDASVGDTIYSITISNYSSAPKKRNCEKAYQLLGKSFALENFKKLSVSEQTIISKIDIEGGYVYFDCKTKYDGIYRRLKADPHSTCSLVHGVGSQDSHTVYSTDINDAVEEAKKVIDAIKILEKNRMINKIECCNNMLKTLESYEAKI